MKKLFLIVVLAAVWAMPAAEARHKMPEKWYQQQFCGGAQEVRLSDGTRVDCLTDEYAVEFDFAPKWAEAVGQSLYYAQKTKKKPGIVLIVEHRQWMKYVENVADLCQRLGITLLFVENY